MCVVKEGARGCSKLGFRGHSTRDCAWLMAGFEGGSWSRTHSFYSQTNVIQVERFTHKLSNFRISACE